jgi:hypothetical protein
MPPQIIFLGIPFRYDTTNELSRPFKTDYMVVELIFELPLSFNLNLCDEAGRQHYNFSRKKHRSIG